MIRWKCELDRLRLTEHFWYDLKRSQQSFLGCVSISFFSLFDWSNQLSHWKFIPWVNRTKTSLKWISYLRLRHWLGLLAWSRYRSHFSLFFLPTHSIFAIHRLQKNRVAIEGKGYFHVGTRYVSRFSFQYFLFAHSYLACSERARTNSSLGLFSF